ncbi:peptidase S8 [Paenibacillus sp. F411]|uniref:S8 family peptidase n=1 Tax=Paenibacillus sp. F411 TaxID=2820239 RepID=UPI001AAFF96E|nr:S8 family peptidase [Paenibacillus sp. F411]MBO2943241.1 peptidase S8 [Paenibacillus sp. F411]
MKSSRIWSYVMAASLLGLSLFFLLSPDPEPSQSQPHMEKAAQHEEASPAQEKTIKLSALDGDLEVTDQLSRMDTKQHLQSMLSHTQLRTPRAVRAFLSEHQRSHRRYESLIWVNLNSGHSEEVLRDGSSLKQSSTSYLKYMKEARQQLKLNKAYQSPLFTSGQDSFYITAEPSTDGSFGAIATVNHIVMSQVKDHQRKNLRLIPYPKEGMYKVESVHSDTLRDLTVKTGHDNEKASHYYENEIVVSFREDLDQGDMQQMMKDISGKSPRKLGYAYVFQSANMTYPQLKSYFTEKWTPLYAEPHYLYLTNTTSSAAPSQRTENSNLPNDLLFSQYQWNLPAIQTQQGWELSKGSEDVVIAVIDTGVDLQHTDLNGRLVDGYNVVNPDQSPNDDVGHGTHVAGIIGALINNGEGVAGMSWYNKIMPIKALDSSGSGTTYAVAEGIIWAVDHGAKVINMSLGNYADSQFLHDAIKYAYDRDCLLVAASGNDNTERPGFPAAYPEVLAVAATNPDMTRAEYSNYGDYIDVTAPGTNIASTYPDNQYAALSGTSMASPHVAAIAGLIRSLNPELTNREVMDLMISQAHDLGDPGKDIYFGNGQVDVFRSLQAADSSEVPLQLWPHHVLNRMQEEIKRLNGSVKRTE